LSTFTCPVVRIEKSGKNPNSDNLRIWNGPFGPVQFREGDFKDGDIACYVPVDSLVPVDLPEFAFLADRQAGGRARVRGVRLRGVPSVGLLVRPPVGAVVGTDLAPYYDIVKYEEPVDVSTSASSALPPTCLHDFISELKYDIENVAHLDEETLGRHGSWTVTEKIHGTNARFIVDYDGVAHVGSRNRFVRHDGSNVWSKTFNETEWLQRLCFDNKGTLFYGEVFGAGVQDLAYGRIRSADVRIFDAIRSGLFLSYDQLLALGRGYDMMAHMPPLLANIYSCTFADAISIAREVVECRRHSVLDEKTIIEGAVVRPAYGPPREWHDKIYPITKVISLAYQMRKGGTEGH